MAEQDPKNSKSQPVLDASILEILNSTRPTYPAGGDPTKQQPSVTIHARRKQTAPTTPTPVVSHAAEPAASQEDAAWRPTVRPTPTPTAAPKQPAAPKPAPAPAPAPTPTPKPQTETPRMNAESVVASLGDTEKLHRPSAFQKRPVVSHAVPGQEEVKPNTQWPDKEELEEVTEEASQQTTSIFRKKWFWIAAAYVLILVLFFFGRLLIQKMHKPAPQDPSTISTDANGAVTDAPLSTEATVAAVASTAQYNNAVTSANEVVNITPATDFVAVLEGNTAPIEVSIAAYGAATSADLQWISSNEAIATVDENGVVTGHSAGLCTIHVMSRTSADVFADIEVAVRHMEQEDDCTYIDGILIVNKTYSIPETYHPGGLVDVAAQAFFDMQNAALADGCDLYIGSSFRSYADQVIVYQQYCDWDGWEKADTYSSRPGHSEHQTGLAIDCNSIDESFDDTMEAAWLEEHCAEYGFIVRFPREKSDQTGYKYESWHIRYVGKQVAQDIQKRGVCLEEYLGVESAYTEDWPNDPCNPYAE